ncbi:MAG: aminotransferase class III-fold pyridoxal phosphate-dependent enzyme [Deltaproteobacteria bacterium]|nr:aminotransferase class III-fold pyridoxal phosphate-dependent enzyme [Deltaproteobacteria bacterium]
MTSATPPLRFTRKPRSQHEARLLALTERLLPTGVRNASMSPQYAMVIKEARGARIVDCSGNEYIDYLLGSGPLLLGHAHPAVVAAVRAQLERGSSYLMVNEPAIELAEQIVQLVPCAEAVCFHSSGSEAVFFALRLARAYRRRNKILKFEGGFHGMSDYALMSNQWTRTPRDYPAAVPNSAGIPPAVAEQVLIAPFNDGETTSALIEQHREELAGVLIEPLQRTIPPRPGFLQALRSITAHYRIPLIFDEVVTGFRLALGGAQEYYGVIPDLCALGKSICGGHPLGVLCGKAEILDLARPERLGSSEAVMLTGTFSANPISASAALACINELRAPGCYDRLAAKGRRLMCGLQQQLDDAGIPARVCGEPSVFQPWFTSSEITDHRSTLTADWQRNLHFIDHLLDAGVVKAHEKFFVSTAHSDEDIDQTLAACAFAVERL